MDFLFGGKPGNGGPAQSGGAAGNLVKEGGTATFAQDVIEASMQVPVIVDFWAPWCGPCKQLGPALEKLVNAAKGAVRMVKINVDQNQQLAGQLRIQSIPTVYAFKGGQPVDGFVGALPESQLKQFIERLTGGADPTADLDAALDEAKAMLAEGDAATAIAIYQEVLAQDPQHTGALAGIVRAAVVSGDLASAKQILDGLPDDLKRHVDITAARTALEVAEQAANTGPAAELRKRVATDPNDHQARFDLAMAYYAAGEREAAVDELLESIRRDRAWNEEAARKQLVKLFDAFGPTDPLTVASRRKLSTILFS